MKRLATFLLLASLASITAAQITVNTLIPEMTDLGKLAKRPAPYYTTSQASSYDRASKTPGNDAWFANGDAGQFVRVETVDGRKERVMADLKGPGAVVRIWSANPGGTLRFYFDGETTPRLQKKAQDLLSGKVAPWTEPFGYVAARGWNLYAPFPYAKSLKITVDDSDSDASANMYYHVGYRTYEAGTVVETFDESQVNHDLLKRIGSRLLDPAAPLHDETQVRSINLNATARNVVGVEFAASKSGSAFRTLSMRLDKGLLKQTGLPWSSPKALHNVLRNLILEIEFDGELCVRAPLGDFFATAPGLNALNQFPFTISKDGVMTCRFVMPFKSRAKVSVRNLGSVSTKIGILPDIQDFPFDANTYYFRAQWTGDTGSTRPIRDMHFLNVIGEGCWIGSNMHIANPSPAWWGEGDEKVFVDGETFPSTFGTGTEDYYGYAWSNNETFQRPYHAQPISGVPGNFGHSNVNRWQIFDPIHFQTSLKFDMEMWHWADVNMSYVRTAYWYAKPGSTGPAAIDTSLLMPVELIPAAPVKGALEGESFKIVSKSGGETEKQEGFFETSSGKQLWWRDGKVGDKLILEIPVSKAGTYKITGNFCHARDYGIHKITINGKTLAPIDFYVNALEWRKIDLGTFDLPKGNVKMEVEIVGTNPSALPRYMFGLDYLKLDKA